MTKIELTVDGASVSDDVEPRMLLVQYLREKLGKTGTVIGSISSCRSAPRLSTTFETSSTLGASSPARAAFYR